MILQMNVSIIPENLAYNQCLDVKHVLLENNAYSPAQ